MRTFLKKGLCLIMAGAFLGACTLKSSANATVVESYAKDPYYEEMMAEQKRAVDAFSVLCEAFDYDENGVLLLPDDYSGSWINGSTLHISLVDTTEETISHYLSILEGFHDCIEFNSADYSYNELYDAELEITEELYSVGIETVSGYIDEIDNCVVIGIQRNDMNRLESLPSFMSESYPIEYEEAKPARNTATSISGGAALYNTSTHTTFTATCMGTYNGTNAMLTCGHTAQKVGDTIKYSSSSGTTIGTVKVHVYSDESKGDYEIVSVSSSFSPSATINNTYYVTGYRTTLTTNTVVKFFSRTAKKFYYGTIETPNMYKMDGNGNVIYGLASVVATSGNAASGDSGGPVFVTGEGGEDICGTISAVESSYLYFSPVSYPISKGFTVKTV